VSHFENSSFILKKRFIQNQQIEYYESDNQRLHYTTVLAYFAPKQGQNRYIFVFQSRIPCRDEMDGTFFPIRLMGNRFTRRFA
jgi:hypothetical protein